jgi:zinc/manganese transport system permease protein
MSNLPAFFQSMAWPFTACLLLAGILVYLGIHVISRKVIFVDLALAQIAALGSVWGVLLGWDLQNDPWAVKAFSLAFTFLGAAVFTLTRMRDERVPHEALIGITYAVALGATILASAHLAHGAEEVSELLAGSILWVRADMVLVTALVFAAVGAFHWFFRKQFFLVSLDPAAAEQAGLSLRLWDFLFYVSLGFAVTTAVAIAGVLLVFSYLVVPAVVAMLFARRIGPRLAIGWVTGTVVSAVGCSVSYFRDLPSGPTIVACFGGFLVAAGLASVVVHAADKQRALVRVVAGTVVLAGLVGGSLLLRKREHHDTLHVLETGSKAEKMLALAEIEADDALWARTLPLAAGILANGENEVRLRLLGIVETRHATTLRPAVEGLLLDRDDAVAERALRVVRALGDPRSADAISAAAAKEEDEYLRVEMAEALLEMGDVRGAPILVDVISTGEAAQARRDAWEHLTAHVEVDMPVQPGLEPDDPASGIPALKSWWQAHAPAMKPGGDGKFHHAP